MQKTVVNWPSDPESTRSTALLLANQNPHSLDLTFDDAAVDAAQGGVLFSTMRPDHDEAALLGLTVESGPDSLSLASGGSRETLSTDGVEEWQLHSDVDGMTMYADGEKVLSWPDVLPPQVDALITAASEVGADSLSASLLVVNDSDTSPTPLKIALMVVMWVALIVALIGLWRDDRTSSATRPRNAARFRPSGVDAVVVGALLLWIFIGPMTDDDGYYAHMAWNFGNAGFVGNYYQVFNHPFTPFTWFWQALWAWQEVGGHSPVWLRIPSFAAAVAAWFLCRAFLDRLLPQRSRRFTLAARLLLGVFFIAWWSAYSIGSRPEAIGALASIAALTLINRAIETRTLFPAAMGALAAALGFAAHTTGGVAFAPLLLGLPALWSIARRNGTSLRRALLRTTAVMSVGTVALFAAFADASIRDMRLNSSYFSLVEQPLGWRDEWTRYSFLLANDPMGSYAKRAVVLIALVCLIWFVVLWVASRSRKQPARVLSPLALAGWSFAVGLIILWVTTSKWTHHFGALAAFGPLLIASVLFVGPHVARQIMEGKRPPAWLPIIVATSFVPAIIVSLRGPNTWAYSWNQFMYASGEPPRIGSTPLASQAIWAVVLIAAFVGSRLVLGRGRWKSVSALYSTTAVVALFGVLSTGYLYGTFGNAAVRGIGSYSVGAANLEDPSGAACIPERSIEVWDTVRGASLEEESVTVARDADGLVPIAQRPAIDLFDNGAFASPLDGEADPVPPGAGSVWETSSDVSSAGASATAWYALPPKITDEQRITALVAGSAAPTSGNGIIAQVGQIVDNEVEIQRESWITDTADRPGWRSVLTDLGPEDLGKGKVLRLIGVDAAATPGSWFGFSAPRLVDAETMRDVVGDSPSLVAWQSSFLLPCANPLAISNGIIEPPRYATTWGNGSPDNIWVESRGGTLVGPSRLASVSTPVSSMPQVGTVWGRLVLFDYGVQTVGYDVSTSPVVVDGISSPFGPLPQLVARERERAAL
ncbi:arabinosyltransferase domain-containing protein [Herbiconiux sp. L3-i23]|uniref:arabinosyltransferase domain-containing protein n=1 Tax=Herbiconiux sp. L3-i23 TaxID=2905871 RepID=UPI0020731D79|nr:arabinosyltransferase domain-containing protein [Herbiconiux sp. L3-i23]